VEIKSQNLDGTVIGVLLEKVTKFPFIEAIESVPIKVVGAGKFIIFN